MKCPKCGYVRQNRDNVFAPPTECPACGVVYAKYLTSDTSSTFGALDVAAGLKKPSPVDEETLKKARERVERRLRKKFNPNEKDEFREQTLQRARQFVSEGVKRRREEMQQRKNQDQEETQAEEAAALEALDDTDQTLAPGESEPAGEQLNGQAGPEDIQATAQDAGEDTDQRVAPAEPETAIEQPEDQAAPEEVQMADQDAGEETDPALASAAPEPAPEQPDHQDEPEAVLSAGQTAVPNHEDQSTEYTASEKTAPPIDTVETVQETHQSDDPTVETREAPAMDEDQNAAAHAGEEDDRVFTIGAVHNPEAMEADDRAMATSEGASEMHEQPSPAGPQAAALANGGFFSKKRCGGLMRFLPAVAWMILVAGVIGAVLSWTTIGDVQAGVNTGDLSSGAGVPVALLLGFAYLATGVLGFAFFWVSSMINIQIKEIHLLLLQPLPRQQEQEEAEKE